MEEGGVAGGDGRRQEEEELLEGVAMLDFDMLCSTVAMQTRSGKWGKLVNLGGEEEEMGGHEYGINGEGRGAFRMWEGELLYDCLDDRRIALQSTCCPCYRFGKNMKRAGSRSCLIQGSIYTIAVMIALINMLAFVVTKRHYFLYLSIAFTISLGAYLGLCRIQIRKRFHIKGSDSQLDDCVYHIICPCCAMCQCCNLEQETRTLEMNNVQNGIWHGRGDTICVGRYSPLGLNPPPILSMKSPEPIPSSHHGNQQNASEGGHPSTPVVPSSYE
ncbi:unnamed protein product [Cuscuta epithymum]|uniref:PLAC8 motif-containing protein n=1 Tax=Cuscuta epithymum TaxID=186058 RepID=A0AAV0E2U6_9ASTE|nr:unnamed protein product [Cuscuta epithymum]